MSERPAEALYGEVLFDSTKVPVVGTVRRANLGRFPSKVVTGDYTKDSDDLLSTWVLSNFSGGGQVEDIEEGAHEGRYWYATLDTTHPNQLALLPLTNVVAGPNTDGAYPLGDLSNNFYAAYGTAVCLVSGTPATAGASLGTLTIAPVGKGKVFKGTGTLQMFIPMGASGYARFTGAAVTNVAAAVGPPGQPAAISMEVWDNKLFALATDGGLWSTTDGSTWTKLLTLDASYTPRHLVGYYNREQAETLHIVTDRSVWAYDPDATKLVKTGMQFPPHPNHGLGATVWEYRLYVSRGLGTEMYDGSLQTPMGVNRDDGLPFAYRGKVIDLCAGDHLFALIEGATTVGDAEETIEMEEGPPEGGLYFGATTTNGSLMVWTGRGWHTLWATPSATGNGTWATVSATTDHHRVAWGYGDDLYYIDLITDNANPKQLAAAGTGAFAANGRLETGDFDAGMTAFLKLGSVVHLKPTLATETATIGVSYSTDLGGTWVSLGQATGTDEVTFPLGIDADGVSRGVAFTHIRFAVEMTRDAADSTVSPIMEYLILEFVKIPKTSHSFAFRVPLSDVRGYAGDQLRDIADEIEDYIGETDAEGVPVTPRFFLFGHRDRTYRARVAQATANEPTGRGTKDWYVDVTVVGVPAE
jgi:hypothetical protein